MSEKLDCPVCGNICFGDDDDDFDFCPNCYWQNEWMQRNNHDFKGGANKISINERKKAFAEGTLEFQLEGYKTAQEYWDSFGIEE